MLTYVHWRLSVQRSRFDLRVESIDCESLGKLLLRLSSTFRLGYVHTVMQIRDTAFNVVRFLSNQHNLFSPLSDVEIYIDNPSTEDADMIRQCTVQPYTPGAGERVLHPSSTRKFYLITLVDTPTSTLSIGKRYADIVSGLDWLGILVRAVLNVGGPNIECQFEYDYRPQAPLPPQDRDDSNNDAFAARYIGNDQALALNDADPMHRRRRYEYKQMNENEVFLDLDSAFTARIQAGYEAHQGTRTKGWQQVKARGRSAKLSA